MRVKLVRPDAWGTCDGARPFRARVTIEMKKVLKATPCTSIGQIIARTSTWEVKPERMKNEMAKAAIDTVATQRASIFDSDLPTRGDRITATMPAGMTTK